MLHYGLIAVAALATAYYLGIFTGAHYVPTPDGKVLRMLKLAKVRPGERLADLGSGDGRFLIEAARQGMHATGFELNPLLVWWSRWRVRSAGVGTSAVVEWRDFWKTDFSGFDVVTIYGIPHIMKALERKLLKELRPGARVVCNAFPFPTWQGCKEENLYVYVQKQKNSPNP